MGSSASKKAIEDLSENIRTGNVSAVRHFLDRASAAHAENGSNPGNDTTGLVSIDLNQPTVNPGPRTPLQWAAACGQPAVIQILIDETGHAGTHLPRVEPNAFDHRKETALHHAVRVTSPPGCSKCVIELIRRRADPCIACVNGKTPLDLARANGCTFCVRSLEDKMQLWSGWVDHEEQLLFGIPKWTARWLVVLKDRWSNTGPNANRATAIVCHSCQSVQQLPGYVFSIACESCGCSLSTTPQLQLAFYDPGVVTQDAMERNLPSNVAVPTLIVRVPHAKGHIIATSLDSAGIRSSLSAASGGNMRRLIQNVISTQREFGVSFKCMDAQGVVQSEHCFRMATEAARTDVLRILRDPVKAAVMSPVPLATGAAVPTGASAACQAHRAEPPDWVCGACTYRNTGKEASLGECSMCATPHPPDSVALDTDIPRASAPPLSNAEVEQLSGAASAPPLSNAEVQQLPPPDISTFISMCAVCLERPPDTAVVPCGHMCGCQACLQAIADSTDPQCPLCRGPVTSVMRIFHN